MPCASIGPQPAPILIVGEAPGQSEEMTGVPFIGQSGQELKRMLAQADIDYKLCRVTNVFEDRPPENKIDNFCVPKTALGKDYPHAALAQGKYFPLERANSALERLRSEIASTQPKLILALGNTACWAVLGRTGISSIRGNVFPCSIADGVSVLPTFHPAAILRNWSDRVVAVQDFLKARRFVVDGFSVPHRELWLEPTLAEVEQFCSDYILDARTKPNPLSFDIETLAGTITCIGFSPSPERAITIPFFDPARVDRNYWPTFQEEFAARRLVRQVLESPIPKLGQNGLYDVQYCYREGIRVNNYREDTMIRHHALYPEMEKGLGFLGTIYTDEAPWKLLRNRGRDEFKLED